MSHYTPTPPDQIAVGDRVSYRSGPNIPGAGATGPCAYGRVVATAPGHLTVGREDGARVDMSHAQAVRRQIAVRQQD